MDKRLLVSLALVAGFATLAFAAAPQWWTDRNVLKTGAAASDYAVVNQGQLKNMARAARDELNARVKGGAGPLIDGMVTTWINSNTAAKDYAPANLGQLKAVAKPFYDRLIEVEVATGYPWSTVTTDDRDYGAANLGQLKSLFSFSIPPPPQAPENLSATSSPSEIAIALQFSYASGNPQTEVERGTNPAGPFDSIAILPKLATTYVDRLLEPGTTYYYRVRATSPVADSPWTSLVSAAAVAAYPLAPTDLRLAVVTAPTLNPTPSSVRLAWTDRADNETGFKVFRSLQAVGSPWSEVGTAGISAGVNLVVEFTDLSVVNDLTYRYHVAAVNARGLSEPTSDLVVQVPPAIPSTPTPFSATSPASDYDSVVLNWGSSQPPRVAGFKIERQIGAQWLTLAEVGPTVRTFQHDGILPGTVGQYRIAAFNETGSSAWASTSATTPTSFAWQSATGNTPKQVTLAWTDALRPLEYTIQRKLTSSSTYVDLVTVSGSTSQYVDRSTMTAGSSYHYRVRSSYAAGLVVNAQITVSIPISKPGNQAPDYLALQPAISGVVRSPSWQQARMVRDLHSVAEGLSDLFYGRVSIAGQPELGRAVMINPQFNSGGGITGWDYAFVSPEASRTGNDFGAVIKTFGDYVVISDPQAIESATGIRKGAIYVYRYVKTPVKDMVLESWVYGPEQSSEFGAAMDLDGTQIIVGSPGYGKHSLGSPVGHGAVFVINYQALSLDLDIYMAQGNARLGASVGLVGRSLVAGAPSYDAPGLTDTGYVLTGSLDWLFLEQFHAFSPADFGFTEHSGERFGAAVDIDRMLRILVGQPGASSGVGNAWCMTWNGRSAFEETLPFGAFPMGAPATWNNNGPTISTSGYGDFVRFADADVVVADANTTQALLREQVVLPLIMGQELGVGRTVAAANSADIDDQWVTLSSVTYTGGSTFPFSKFVFAPTRAPSVLSVADFTTGEIPANDLRRIALRAQDDWGANIQVTPWFVRYSPVELPLDSDSDGIPDAWELANGMDKNSGADALADYDFDGLTNLQEYLANLNPRLWGLPNPDGDNDYDEDGIPDHLDARPTVPSAGDQFGVVVSFPPNGSTLVP